MGSFRLIEKHLSFQKKQAFRCLLFIWEIWEIWGAGKGMLQSRRVQAPFGADGIGTGTWAVLSSIPEGACACGAEGPMASIGPLALGAKGCGERLHRFAQGAADWRSGPRWRIISALCPVHPFPLRGTSPRWEACHWIFRSLRSLTNPVPLPPQGETRK